ncbi:chloramphenicol acetyltransferase [Nitritalea halalkaliphila LW7]|uniref:Chloramphenicol acetyltransferase n=1 Tax=Nitritalea halalkaliphila LW7 TaxID=1189621 RepID=I5CAI2_9BACT|nr:CatA-like O-acetyltransferase [Nitritalea halalkaliphila]EIM78834.1 chloramphenicol acetyltransferase [Nitritalea halalkaliphila LW7]
MARKEHFQFFNAFEEPFFGVCATVHCHKAYKRAKKQGVSFFLYYLYRALKAVNELEAFKLRVVDNTVYRYTRIDGSCTIMRKDNTFGFSYIPFQEDEQAFYRDAARIVEEVSQSASLFPARAGEGVIHFSSLPWLNFSSVSHARPFKEKDSCRKLLLGNSCRASRVNLCRFPFMDTMH